jgi:TonB family protein
MILKGKALTASILLAAGLFTSPTFGQEAPISDEEIRLVHDAKLEYPTLARTALIQGVVVVRAKLDEKGEVVAVTALSGADAFVPACLDNAKKWRFKPNSKKEVIIVYNFRITTSKSKPGCSRFRVNPPNFATITACAPEIQ